MAPLQGVPPATLAEFTLGINGNPDNYDGEQDLGSSGMTASDERLFQFRSLMGTICP